MVASRLKKGRRRADWAARALGLVGSACLAAAAVALWHRGPAGDVHSALDGAVQIAAPAAPAALKVDSAEQTFYPLEVGRYWIYRRHDPSRGTTTEVERRIVRRESRAERDVYFFDDGTVAYREDGKVFEMGPEGGVNVVVVDAAQTSAPYAYRSQGLHIEKEVGVRDTLLTFDGLRYERCVQVVTHFRRVEEAQVMSYASYYSPGVGLVGRETWPRRENQPMEVLLAFGSRKL